SGESPIKPVSGTEKEESRAIEPAVYYKRVESMSGPQVVEIVRQSFLTWSTPTSEGPAVDDHVSFNAGSGASAAAAHSLFGWVASAIGPARESIAPPGRQTPPRNMEVVKVTQSATTSPCQGNAIQSIGYEASSNRSWTPGQGAEAKPA